MDLRTQLATAKPPARMCKRSCMYCKSTQGQRAWRSEASGKVDIKSVGNDTGLVYAEAMVKQGVLNQKHYTILRRQMLLKKCKLFLHVTVQDVWLLELAGTESLTTLISSYGRKLASQSRNSWKKKGGPVLALFCLCLAQSWVSCFLFLNTMSRAW